MLKITQNILAICYSAVILITAYNIIYLTHQPNLYIEISPEKNSAKTQIEDISDLSEFVGAELFTLNTSTPKFSFDYVQFAQPLIQSKVFKLPWQPPKK